MPSDENRADRLLRRFATPIQVVMTLGLYVQLALIYGVAAYPTLLGLATLWRETGALALELRLLFVAVGAAFGFFVFAVVLIGVVGLVRFVTRGRTPEGRFSYYSMSGIRWATYNALILSVRFTVMDFLRVTPLLVLFHRLMGMKCGARVQLNTKVIADSNLIEVGDDSIIGGDVTLVCHSAERGKLVTAPVKIGRGVTVGLMAVIFPGCEIGDGAVIAAQAVLPKGTRVPAGTVWAGIPAKQVSVRGGAAPQP